MRSIDIREAKTRLSRLVEEAARGEPFVIAKAGRPLVQVPPLAPAPEPRKPCRVGFMEGRFPAPDDFDTMGQAEIERMFYGDPPGPVRKV